MLKGLQNAVPLDCQPGHTFRGSVDMSSVKSDPTVVTLNQGEASSSLEIKNEFIPLRFSTLEEIPASNSGDTHKLRGWCDGSAVAGSVVDVTIKIASLGIDAICTLHTKC